MRDAWTGKGCLSQLHPIDSLLSFKAAMCLEQPCEPATSPCVFRRLTATEAFVAAVRIAAPPPLWRWTYPTYRTAALSRERARGATAGPPPPRRCHPQMLVSGGLREWRTEGGREGGKVHLLKWEPGEMIGL